MFIATLYSIYPFILLYQHYNKAFVILITIVTITVIISLASINVNHIRIYHAIVKCRA
jgi:amino acid permease